MCVVVLIAWCMRLGQKCSHLHTHKPPLHSHRHGNFNAPATAVTARREPACARDTVRRRPPGPAPPRGPNGNRTSVRRAKSEVGSCVGRFGTRRRPRDETRDSTHTLRRLSHSEARRPINHIPQRSINRQNRPSGGLTLHSPLTHTHTRVTRRRGE